MFACRASWCSLRTGYVANLTLSQIPAVIGKALGSDVFILSKQRWCTRLVWTVAFGGLPQPNLFRGEKGTLLLLVSIHLWLRRTRVEAHKLQTRQINVEKWKAAVTYRHSAATKKKLPRQSSRPSLPCVLHSCHTLVSRGISGCEVLNPTNLAPAGIPAHV